MASQITSLTIVYSTVYSGADQSKQFRVTGFCAVNSPGTGEFPAQMASNAENVSIWWRHHKVKMSFRDFLYRNGPGNDGVPSILVQVMHARLITDVSVKSSFHWEGSAAMQPSGMAKFLLEPSNITWFRSNLVNENSLRKLLWQGSFCVCAFVYAPSQWQTTLQCNVVSHWLGAFTKRLLSRLQGK